MKCHVGVDKDSGLIHSMAATAGNVSDVATAAELLHGQEEVLYSDAGYQGLENREEMAGKTVECRIAMRPGKRRQLPDTPEGHLQELCEKAKAHIRAKVEHVFRVLKQQLGFSKTRLRGLKKRELWIRAHSGLGKIPVVLTLLGLSSLFSAPQTSTSPCGRPS